MSPVTLNVPPEVDLFRRLKLRKWPESVLVIAALTVRVGEKLIYEPVNPPGAPMEREAVLEIPLPEVSPWRLARERIVEAGFVPPLIVAVAWTVRLPVESMVVAGPLPVLPKYELPDTERAVVEAYCVKRLVLDAVVEKKLVVVPLMREKLRPVIRPVLLMLKSVVVADAVEEAMLKAKLPGYVLRLLRLMANLPNGVVVPIPTLPAALTRKTLEPPLLRRSRMFCEADVDCNVMARPFAKVDVATKVARLPGLPLWILKTVPVLPEELAY